MPKQQDLSSVKLSDWDNCILQKKRREENRGIVGKKRHIMLKHF